MTKGTKRKLLDLFCGQGGASMGYHMAGFEVTGVDLSDHSDRYPFEFIQADALTVDLSGYDAFAASPPCQGYSRMKHRTGREYPKLIAHIRERLEATGKPFIIENVEDAAPEMREPAMLCGSSFGLRVRRHRIFETSFEPGDVPTCDHTWQDSHKPYRLYVGKSRTNGLGYRESGIQPVYGGNHNVGGNSVFLKSVAMGIDWMDEAGLNESIPPAFTRYLGRKMLAGMK